MSCTDGPKVMDKAHGLDTPVSVHPIHAFLNVLTSSFSKLVTASSSTKLVSSLQEIAGMATLSFLIRHGPAFHETIMCFSFPSPTVRGSKGWHNTGSRKGPSALVQLLVEVLGS